MRRPHRARLLPRSSGARCIRSSTWQRADAKGGRTERVWGKKRTTSSKTKPARDERRRRDEGRRDDGGRRIVPPDRTVRARTIDAPPRRRRTSRPRRWLCCVSWLVSRRHGYRWYRRARRLTRRRERVAGCACGSSPPPRYRRGGSSRASVVMMKGQARVATENAEAGVAFCQTLAKSAGERWGWFWVCSGDRSPSKKRDRRHRPRCRRRSSDGGSADEIHPSSINRASRPCRTGFGVLRSRTGTDDDDS